MWNKIKKTGGMWLLITMTITIIFICVFRQFVTVENKEVQEIIGAIAFFIAAVITDKIT